MADVPPTPKRPASRDDDLPPEGLDGMFDALSAQLEGEQRSQTGWRARLADWGAPHRRLAALAVAVLVPLFALARLRDNAAEVLDLPHLATLLFAAGTASLFGIRAVRGWHEPSGRPARAALSLLSSLAVLLLLLVLPHGHGLPAHGALPQGVGVGLSSAVCFAYGLAFAAPVYLAVRLLGHDSPFSRPYAAAAAALSGNLALVLHCPYEVTAHLVAGHGGLLAVALLLGAALERRRTA